MTLANSTSDSSIIFRPHLLLLRTRLLIAALVAFAMVFFIVFITSAGSFSGLGVFWHHPCGCPLDPSDTRALLSVSPIFLLAGLILGISTGFGKQRTPGSSRFLLTRPIPRLHVLLLPFLICGVAIATLPGLPWLLLLGWMRLVHAPALGHLAGLLKLAPSARALGPHTTFAELAAATHLGRFYLAGISLGLDAYVVYGSSRWLLQSRHSWIKWIGVLSPLSLYLFPSFLLLHWIPRSVLFLMPHDPALTYVPSTMGIALHFAFAAAWFCGTYLVLCDIEL